MRGLRKIGACLLAVLTIGGCASVDCPLTNAVYSHWGFYTQGQPATLLDTLYIYARVHGQDTLLVNKLYNAHNVDLPFSYYLPADTFRMELHQGGEDGQVHVWADQVIVKKDNLDHFNSPECGIWHEHSVTDISCTGVIIDSIQVVKPKIDTHEDENIRIYFK